MRTLALAAALLATACGPVLYAELEIPSVQVKLPSQSFPAAAPLPVNQCPTPQTGCVYQTFSYDLGSQVSVLDDKNVTSQIRLTSLAVDLTAGSALADFGGIASITMSVLAPDGTALPGVTVASYHRSAADPNPHAISVAGNSNVDLAPYLEAGKLTIASEMVVDAGTPDFTADVTSDFYLKVKIDYGKLAGL
ncbi:MAG TPA: hypothetical protein VLU43_03730 [Anaeromyxobacteraceae bacterium]|nr:hypothetical protein [Anaeromyxobacteraceae bacterium]